MGKWQPIATAPKDGTFLVANKLKQVCYAESSAGQLLIHNNAGYADWTFGANATHWMPLPDPPEVNNAD